MEADKIIKTMNEIGTKIERGEKEGTAKCPYCGGTVNYVSDGHMALKAWCNDCQLFRVFA